MSIHLRISNVLGGTAMLLGLALAGCGESTNIQPKSLGAVRSCSSLLGVTCVSGRLIDDAVGNVDYECVSPGGVVRSVTADDGSFSCPNGSDVKFFLANPDLPEQQIPLGTVKVLAPARVYGDEPPFQLYFYVTPRTLAGDASGMTLSTAALNITRLLQTLSRDTVDADLSRNLPSRRIIISDDDKRKITATTKVGAEAFLLGVAANPALPADDTFDAVIRPYLLALADSSRDKLIGRDAATGAVLKGLYSTVAGSYLVPGSLLAFDAALSGGGFVSSPDVGAMVGRNRSSGESFVGSMYALVDRRGRVIANGLYSYGTPSGGDAWALWSDPQAMDLTGSGEVRGGFPVWPLDGDLTRMQFALRGSADSGRMLRLSRGVMQREAVAGSAAVYENLFQEIGGDSLYGQWTLGTVGSPSSFISDGAYTFERVAPVATLMNPGLWDDSVVGGFPVPVTISIYNSDYGNALCARTPTKPPGCKMGEMRVLVLEDGNIVSDRYGTCGAGASLNRETLVVNNDPTKVEVPLGTVSSITADTKDDAGAAMTTMVLLALIPNSAALNDALFPLVKPELGFAEYLRYVQFGANLGGVSLLRVDGVTNRFQMYGPCTAALSTAGACSGGASGEKIDTLQPGIATWVNYYTFAKAIRAQKLGLPSFPELNANASGILTSTRSTCPP